jgi:very-short-patch-repair endonuclease
MGALDRKVAPGYRRSRSRASSAALPSVGRVKPKPLIGYRAIQARSQIESLLAGTGWFLTVETRVQDAIQLDAGETVPEDLAPMFKRGRFDFVIVSTDAAVLRLVIELDGPTHDDPLAIARDVRKDLLCLDAGLPIVRLAIAHLEPQDQSTALEWVVGEFVRFQKEYPKVRRQWRSASKREAEFNRRYPDSAHLRGRGQRNHDAEIDTLARDEWTTHQRRRFPAIDRVVERLARRHSIFEDDPPAHVRSEGGAAPLLHFAGQF